MALWGTLNITLPGNSKTYTVNAYDEPILNAAELMGPDGLKLYLTTGDPSDIDATKLIYDLSGKVICDAQVHMMTITIEPCTNGKILIDGEEVSGTIQKQYKTQIRIEAVPDENYIAQLDVSEA